MDPTVQTLVSQLSNGEADLTEAQNIYNDVVGKLSSFPILTNFQAVNASAGQVPLPATARKLLYVAYNNSTIGEISQREATWLFPDWPDITGTPQAYMRESVDQRTLQLIPPPAGATPTTTVIYAESRQTLPTYLQLPVALYILEHEYIRESDHHNDEIAAACKMLADFLISVIMKTGKEGTQA